ncbi:MAG: flagellar hook capping protein [Cupriavidus sp.]|nr:flagellar hook capping protein [Cupriavidus sp.]
MSTLVNINPSARPSRVASTDVLAANSATNNSQIAGNFTQFLTLLTTQLKNQNPLSPMDTNQFTQQLVQFAQVEQQLKSNARLDSIASSAKNSESASLSSYIGKSITTDGITAELGSSGAMWSLSASRAASKATITISDSKNNVVCVQTQHLTAGPQSFSWDGRTSSGLKASAGVYTIKIDAVDASGQKVTVDTGASGRVDGIDLAGSSPALMVGKNRVPTSAIKQVSGL